MKWDMELVRKIVFAIDAWPSGFAPNPLNLEGYTEEQVGYHVHIMVQAGLVDGVDVTHQGSRSRTSPQAVPRSLTWAGHEFADAARNDTVWKKAMQKLQELGQTVTVGVLMQLLTSLAKSRLGLP